MATARVGYRVAPTTFYPSTSSNELHCSYPPTHIGPLPPKHGLEPMICMTDRLFHLMLISVGVANLASSHSNATIMAIVGVLAKKIKLAHAWCFGVLNL